MHPLDQAIAGLYAAFADARAPVRIEGCPCCADRKTAPSLLHRPLREIPLDDLERYAFSAITTVGSETDYLYFLPRIVEIAATEPSRGPDIPVTAGKIAATGFASWPARRREALLAVIDCTVEHLLATAEHDALDDWLCACAWLEIDLRPRLARIEARQEAVLACFTTHERDLASARLRSGYWKAGSQGHDQFVEWLRSPAVGRIAADAYGYARPMTADAVAESGRRDDISPSVKPDTIVLHQPPVMHEPQAHHPRAEAYEPLDSALHAGRLILQWTEEVNEHQLWADKQRRAAVERQFEVIAEALARLRDSDEPTWHRVVDAATAIRLGEAIRREYDSIDYGILWRAARKELPLMLASIETVLEHVRR